MTSSKNTKRALLASVLSVALCCAMLIGSTFAWFTDSVTSTGNKIVAGNLKVDLIHVGGGRAGEEGITEGADVSIKDNPEHKIFDYDKWEPGYTVMETLKVVNEGNLALKFRLVAVAEDAVAGPNDEKLADVIDVWVYEGEGIPEPESFEEVTAEDSGWRNAGSLSKLMADTDGIAYGVLLPEGATAKQENEVVGSVQMTVALHMQECAGNAYQELSLGDLNFTLSATQYTFEDDGFGDNQYDITAEYPIATSDEGKAALVDTETPNIVMGSNITITSEDNIRISTDKTIDFDGNTVTRESQSGSGIVIGQNPATYQTTPVTVTMNDGNFAATGSTPVVRVESGSTAIFRNCSFDGSTPFQGYAAEEGEKTTLVFEDCTFTGKVDLSTASGDGRQYDVTFRNCTFTGTFGNGGASVSIDSQAYGTVTLENCSIDIEYTGNAVRGIDIGSYYGSNGNNPIVVNLVNTDIAIDKSASAAGNPNVGSPVGINSKDITTLNISGECTFTVNGTEKTFNTVDKEWVNAQ